MKFTLIATTIFAALASAKGLKQRYFKLQVSPCSDSAVAGKYITLTPTGGAIGIYPGQPDFQGYIVDATKRVAKGTIASAQDPNKILYLRPTHGTPQYFALLGDPNTDPTPALTLSKDFTIAEKPGKGGMTYWLDYSTGSATSTNWVACAGSNGEYNLYYGNPTTWCEPKQIALKVIYAIA